MTIYIFEFDIFNLEIVAVHETVMELNLKLSGISLGRLATLTPKR